jgi:hypothetical protein
MPYSKQPKSSRIEAKMRWINVAALLLLALPAPAQQDGTLRSALHEEGLPLDSPVLPALDQKITGGAELDSPEQFAIAYYLDKGTRNLVPPLYVLRFDRKTRTWQKGEIGDSAEAVIDPCLSQVLDVRSFGEGLVIETHINPSAGCALLLSGNLKLEATLDGWVLDAFSDGALLYHRSQVHFATVHPAEIAVFDPRAKKDFTIFPPKAETPVRQRLIAELREFFKTHQDYCRAANDPCDPLRFDSALDGKVALDNREHALAFSISYRLQGYGQEESKPAGPGSVIYVYRNADDESKWEVRELLPAELRAQFGEISLSELLEPERLKLIFQK